MCAHARARAYVRMCVCACACAYVRMCVCAYVRVRACACVRVRRKGGGGYISRSSTTLNLSKVVMCTGCVTMQKVASGYSFVPRVDAIRVPYK